MEKDKILILTGHYGAGHKQAADAINLAIKQEDSRVETVVIDPASVVHPTVDLISRNVFIGGVKRFPSTYHYFYEKTRERNWSSKVLKGMNRFGIRKVLQLLDQLQPTVIVSTCPIASGMISVLKEYGLVDTPFITVITDYSAHSYWIYPYTDAYFVGSEKVRQGLQSLGVDGAKITVTGIPIDPKFSVTYNRQYLRGKYEVKENMPTVLIAGGGYGMMGKGCSVFQKLEEVPFEMQLIMVCGHNQRLYQQLEKQSHASKHRVLLTGYVDYIEELMAISDLMITKAGGLTVSEAIAMNLPMLLYPSIGGQEHDNTQFLLETKTAWLAHNADDLPGKTIQMLKDPDLLAELQNHEKQLGLKHTAFDVVQEVLDMIPGQVDDVRLALT